MAYLLRNASKRVDPQLVLPGARSIVTLAVAYGEASSAATPPQMRFAEQHTEEEAVTRNAAHNQELSPFVAPAKKDDDGDQNAKATLPRLPGIIARYARFSDYHNVLGEPLKRLTEYINDLGGEGTRSLWYVDTGPLLERDLAQRAGLGFIGKHTNLISRELGNWFFLAEILTTLELDPDESEKNRCGTCTRCIAACPTRAITGPFQLDARRCISYLTIELKGSIPEELRHAIGSRVYGCDDCLTACPWNRFAQEGQLMKKHQRHDLATPDLTELLSLNEAGFKRRFAGTPMLRTKRRGLLRNACVALGNVGGTSALPALERAASDPEPLIAEHAHWAIGQIKARQRNA
jgi:epoxyqueuosine reductase